MENEEKKSYCKWRSPRGIWLPIVMILIVSIQTLGVLTFPENNFLVNGLLLCSGVIAILYWVAMIAKKGAMPDYWGMIADIAMLVLLARIIIRPILDGVVTFEQTVFALLIILPISFVLGIGAFELREKLCGKILKTEAKNAQVI